MAGIVASRLRSGVVIPAHPLALDASGEVDWRAQRALSRYYVDAGAHGLAVGVHTTQFELHEDPALLRDVLGTAMHTAAGSGMIMIAGVTGDVRHARTEVELAHELGYDAVLLSLRGCDPDAREDELIERSTVVGEVLPTIGFYMQESIGGRYLTPEYWRALFDLESTIAVKTAPFDRYRTHEVAQAILESDRWRDIALLTGNDDAIVHDLITPYRRDINGQVRHIRATGGLLGQWAVGTRAAAILLARLMQAPVTVDDLATATELVEINAALFDVRHHFRGAVAGVNELLTQQGLLDSSRCLSERETLSQGQRDRISDVRHRFPALLDEQFVAANRDRWLDD